MSETLIKAVGLGKRYRIHHRQRSHSFRETIVEALKAPIRRLKSGTGQATSEDFWALDDVSFEVKQGDVVGFVGRNGAGKSTLLKVLSRITAPSAGRVELLGRVGSLLEVGTGFHPELSGRDNIYLNGAILGMSHAEVKRKFDEIVDFAEVERFIDTPVKHYSSGMYTRLAFAVASSLEPEVLIIDEVLAVGDDQFQKKCLGKMKDVAASGRTVLFVSHNLGMVSSLCTRCILLQRGKVQLDSTPDDVIREYLKGSTEASASGFVEFEPRKSKAYFTRLSMIDDRGQSNNNVDVRKPYTFKLDYLVKDQLYDLELTLSIFTHSGHHLFDCHRSICREDGMVIGTPGMYTSSVRFPSLFLAPGMYFVKLGLHQPNVTFHDQRIEAFSFTVMETGSAVSKYYGADIGSLITNFPWETTARPLNESKTLHPVI